MAELRFYNTLTHREEVFIPIDATPDGGGRVTMYNCGPTVYDFAHIGNFKTFLFSDVLRRVLELVGYRVHQVMNLTDVGHMTEDQLADGGGEDKMQVAAQRLAAAKKSGDAHATQIDDPRDPYQVAQFYIDAFLQDARLLGLKVADEYPRNMPRATDHVRQMAAMVQQLIEKGHAYAAADGAVYFSVESFPDYGKLSGNRIEQLQGGAGGPGGSNGLLGRVPRDVDADARLEPGSVLAVPLAFGDVTLAGHGTVTDVLPDGRVLGFGHSMMGMGPIALPVATGYAHFVVPRSQISFRLATALRTAGTMLRDENTAVTATPALSYRTSPLTVRTDMPGQAQARYAYDVVHHPTLTPIITAVLGIQSLTAHQDTPLRSTVYVEGELRFAGDRAIPIRTVSPDGGGGSIAASIIPLIAPMLDNPFERLTFDGGDLTVRVVPELRSAQLTYATLDRSVAQPGQTVRLTARLVSAATGPYTVTHDLVVPTDIDDGDAEIVIGGLDSFAFRSQMTEPYRYIATDVDELTEVLTDLAAMPDDALYVSALWPQQESLAVGRTPLPKLPSSRRAMIGTLSQSTTMPFPRTTADRVELDDVPLGELRLVLTIRDPAAAD